MFIMSDKIILVGYMAAGKSMVAQKLSKHLKIATFDLDDLIEKKLQMSILEIFKIKGELFFRKMEHQIFKEMMESQDSFILSTGGGTPCYANNHFYLKKEFGHSFYLKTSVQSLVQRLEHETKNRPILHQNAGIELEEFIAKHLFDRGFYYMQAQHIISTDDKSIEIIAQEIASIFNNLN